MKRTIKEKIVKQIVAFMCVAVLGVIGTGTVWAASGGITATVSSSRIAGTYTYGAPGHQLKIELYGYEKKGSGEAILKTTAITNGSYTSVSATATPDAGYSFYKLSAYGFVDGNLDAAKLNVTP